MADGTIPVELRSAIGGPDPRLRHPAEGAWPADEKRRYFIQFKHSLLREERQEIQANYGLLLETYVPKYIYLEFVDRQTLERLQQDPLVHAVFPFQAGDKISPGIGKTKFRTQERESLAGHLLRAILFADANAEAVRSRIEGLGAIAVTLLDDPDRDGTTRIMFVATDPTTINRIAEIDGVSWIEEVPEPSSNSGIPNDLLETGRPHVTPITGRGLRGLDQIVGVLDSGVFPLDHCWFRDDAHSHPGPHHRKVVNIFDAMQMGNAVHATFVAGILAGDDDHSPGTAPVRGIACDARIAFGNREDFRGMGTAACLYDYVKKVALDAAHTTLQAHVVNASWHTNGNPQYTQDAVDVDRFTRKYEKCLIVGSSGNTGEELGPPGTAKNAICVAAAHLGSSGSRLGDGCTGPTEDQRRKPDLLAPGCNIESADAQVISNTCHVLADAALGIPSPGLKTVDGVPTFCAASFATPVVSAAATIVRQYFVEGWYPTGHKQPDNSLDPSAALLKAMLLNATEKPTVSASTVYPADDEGWGLLQLDRVLRLPGGTRKIRIWDVFNTNGVFTGDACTHTVTVKNANKPLKVTLVWTEPPGQLFAENPVVNDLDLEVMAPNGTQKYLGNCFQNGFSDPGGAPDLRKPDPHNNVEMVLVDSPSPGDWAITIKAREINIGNTGQGYALVVRGNLS